MDIETAPLWCTMESGLLETMKEEEENFFEDLSLTDMKVEPEEADMKDVDQCGHDMERDLHDEVALNETKAEPNFERVKEETNMEVNFEVTENTWSMESKENATKRENDDEEALMKPAFVRVYVDFEGASEETKELSEGISKEMHQHTHIQCSETSCSLRIASSSSTQFPSLEENELTEQKHCFSECRSLLCEQFQCKKSFADASSVTTDDNTGQEKACYRYLPEARRMETQLCHQRDCESSTNCDGHFFQREKLGSTSLKRECERDKRERKEETLDCYTDEKKLVQEPMSVKHKQMQTEKRPFKCSHCGKASKSKIDLKRHMYTHTGQKFTCSQCGKTSKSKGDLIKHQRIHTGESPFLCDQCGKACKSSSDLKSHKRTHTGERPFKCDQCRKAYKSSGELKCHMRTHTGERPFKCSQCGNSFTLSGNLTVHMRIHTGEKPFKCSRCGKSFAHSSSLTKHMRSHSGERPFKCNRCGKGFKRSDDLTQHMRTHPGQMPFKCGQ